MVVKFVIFRSQNGALQVGRDLAIGNHNAPLDGMGFSPLGSVVEGMDIVEGLYSGYGEMKEMNGNGPSQSTLMSQGKPYLDKNFPKLDSIKSATIVESAAPAAPAVKKAAPAAGSDTKTGAPAPKSAPPPPPAKKQ